MSLQKFLIKTAAISHSLDYACPHCHSAFLHCDGYNVEEVGIAFGDRWKCASYIDVPVAWELNPWRNIVFLLRCHHCQAFFFYLEMRKSLAPSSFLSDIFVDKLDYINPDQSIPKAYFLASSPLLRLRWLGLRLITDHFYAEVHRFPPCRVYTDPKQYAEPCNQNSPGWKRISKLCNWVNRLYPPFLPIPGFTDRMRSNSCHF
jgi:hypothetical protein